MHPPGLLEFHPVLKRIRWGGRRLGTVLGKPIGPENDYAESWEVSTHPHGMSIVKDGPFAGWTLQRLIEQFPREILGSHHVGGDFPLLIKFLDAHDRLSVQVHPDDERARQFEPDGRGKTESWVILSADPGARLFVGLKEGVTPERLRHSLDEGTVESCLHSFPVSAGDCVFIPAGTVHAIGEGILLAEIQQSSDITFRLYDWGRLGSDGQPRPLHIEEALQCIDWERGPVSPLVPQVLSPPPAKTEQLVDCPCFLTRRYTAEEPFALQTNDSFLVVMTLQGSGQLDSGSETRPLHRGTTVLIPACCPVVTVTPHDNTPLILLTATQPQAPRTGFEPVSPE